MQDRPGRLRAVQLNVDLDTRGRCGDDLNLRRTPAPGGSSLPAYLHAQRLPQPYEDLPLTLGDTRRPAAGRCISPRPRLR